MAKSRGFRIFFYFTMFSAILMMGIMIPVIHSTSKNCVQNILKIQPNESEVLRIPTTSQRIAMSGVTMEDILLYTTEPPIKSWQNDTSVTISSPYNYSVNYAGSIPYYLNLGSIFHINWSCSSDGIIKVQIMRRYFNVVYEIGSAERHTVDEIKAGTEYLQSGSLNYTVTEPGEYWILYFTGGKPAQYNFTRDVCYPQPDLDAGESMNPNPIWSALGYYTIPEGEYRFVAIRNSQNVEINVTIGFHERYPWEFIFLLIVAIIGIIFMIKFMKKRWA